MKNPYTDMAARWDEANARRLGNTPSPQVPKPPPAPTTAAATAAFIVNAGRWRRAEQDEGGAPLEHQNESGQEVLEPGDLILNAIKKQRGE
jgi:hypothetical protein